MSRRLASPILVALLFAPLIARAEPSNAWSVVDAPGGGPARAIGGVTRGCLAGAVRLADDGPGYQVIRLSRRRDYGHPDLVAFIARLGRQAQAAGLQPFYVGDMAQPRGGPLPFGHASHQTGLDVDIWLTLQPKPYLPPQAREDVDLPSMLLANYREIDPRRFGPKQVALLRLAAADPRVERIFVNPVIKAALCRSELKRSESERAWLERIRPWYGHDEHFHVRLRCPAGSPDCEEQRPVPAGDGCGAELASWLAHLPPRPPETASLRNPTLPAQCRAVLDAP
jgi:penicillin-insensitive murein DD-endopeptidase